MLVSAAAFNLNNAFTKSQFPDEYRHFRTVVVEPGTCDFWLHAVNPYYRYTSPVITDWARAYWPFLWGLCPHIRVSASRFVRLPAEARRDEVSACDRSR
jgi:hypothetical protein